MKVPTSVRLKADPTTRRRRSSDGLSPNCPRKVEKVAPQPGLRTRDPPVNRSAPDDPPRETKRDEGDENQ